MYLMKFSKLYQLSSFNLKELIQRKVQRMRLNKKLTKVPVMVYVSPGQSPFFSSC